MTNKVRYQEWNGDTQHAVHYVLTVVEKALKITSQQSSKDMVFHVPTSLSTEREFEDDINSEDIPF
ncbi:hypothetical protein [Candidatus Jettenia sp. AMX1]|uniref:hypothetical protein n=1 Tax=Candidatus Jettenia sp. AMX1 TaxID=2293637 RepID=UPI0025556FC4|nr:hypothetical protein [Candidatus Jettenia sp. AMX1]MDL1938442.1 hypothetical protein [Candidatus Jettenia sp. AMX1]